jgi:phage terminase large subunit
MALPLTQAPTSSTWKLSKDEYFAGLGYEPHKKQWLVHDSDAHFRVVVAGRRWGKSKSAAKEGGAELINPGTLGAVVAPSHDHTGLVFNEIVKDMLGTAGLKREVAVHHKSSPRYLEFKWGSSVRCFSADNYDSARGYEFDWLIFDEAAQSSLSVWEEALDATLHDRNGWALFITTPQGYNYIYDFYMRGKNSEEPEWWSLQSPTWDNPYHNKARLEVARRNLTDAVFRQEYGAEFTIMSGQVYKEFSQEIHVKSSREIKNMVQEGWPRYRAMDYGYDNPTVVLWITVDPEDRVIIYDEFYRTGITSPKVANSLVRKSTRRNKDAETLRSGAIYETVYRNKYVPLCDDKDTQYEWTVSDVSGKAQRMAYAEMGIPAFGYKQDMMFGLNLVRERFKVRSDGTPGFYISDKCVNTIREFNLYSYPKSSDGEALKPDEKPVKKYDHAMDAFRYFVYAWKRGMPQTYLPKRN